MVLEQKWGMCAHLKFKYLKYDFSTYFCEIRLSFDLVPLLKLGSWFLRTKRTHEDVTVSKALSRVLIVTSDIQYFSLFLFDARPFHFCL